MKILHISHSMKIGGAERALYQLIRGQVQSDLEPELLVLSRGGYYAEQTAELGVPVQELEQSSGYDSSVRGRFLEIAAGFDVAHFQTQSPLLMHAATKLRDVELAYTHRGGQHQHGWKRRLMFWWTGRALRKFRYLSGNTWHAAQVAARTFGLNENRFCVTYNGLDFSLFQAEQSADDVWGSIGGKPENKFILGTSANLRDWKRIDWLIESISQLPDPEQVLCLVIGDGPVKQKLQDLASQRQVSDQVRFVGQQKNVADWLQLVDVFVLPSNDGESFGNSAVEAIGVGIPTIVMDDCGGMREHYPEHLRSFPKTIGDLAQQIQVFRNDRTRAQRFASECQSYVLDKYTIDRMVEGYRRMYEQDGTSAYPGFPN